MSRAFDVHRRAGLGVGVGHAGVDQAEGHRVDVDLEAAPFAAQRARHADHAGLGRRVVHLAGIAVERRGRRDVDDLAIHLEARFLVGRRAAP